MGDRRFRNILGRLQVTGKSDGSSIRKLAESLHELYCRLGEPNYLSLLDGRLRVGWRTSEAGLDRYEEISMDTQFLCYISRTPGGSCEIDIHIYGYEPSSPGPGG